jgi:hypothetical protein
LSETQTIAPFYRWELLPVNDPARNFNFHQVQLTPIQWQSGSDLICEIVGAGRRVDPLQEDTDAMATTAFVTVGYRLTIRFGEHTGTVLAAEQMQYELNE